MAGVVAIMPRRELTEGQKRDIWALYVGLLAGNSGKRPRNCMNQIMDIFGKKYRELYPL